MANISEVISNGDSLLEEELCVYVRRQPNDYKIAKYKLSDLKNIEWRFTSGGVQTSFMGMASIYGLVCCQGAIEGEVAHSGVHGSCPHEILVCALKKDNEKIYERLSKLAGPKPSSAERAKPSSGNTCKVDIFKLLKEKKTMRKIDIIDELVDIGHGENNVNIILKKLDKHGNVVSSYDPKDRRYKVYTYQTDEK